MSWFDDSWNLFKQNVGATPPPAQNYAQIASQQGGQSQTNTENQTLANRPNQVTPWGTVNWTKGADGQWTQNMSLNPDSRAAFDAQNALAAGRSEAGLNLLGQVKGQLGQPINYGSLTQLGNGQDAMQQAQGSAYNQMASRLDPQWNHREDLQRNRLMSQGLDPSSEAYQNSMGDFGRQRNDAYSSAMNNSIGLGNQAAQQQFGMNMASHQQGLSELMQQHNQGLNDMNALLGGQQVSQPNMPSFMGASQAQTPNLLGAAEAQDKYGLDAWNQGNANMGAAVGGMTGLGGNLAKIIPFS